MNRGQLFNQQWSIMIRYRALWVVALLGMGISTVANLVLSTPSVLTSIIITSIGLVTTAFTTGALVSIVNSAAEGQAVAVSDSIQAGTRRILPLIVVRVLLMLPIWIVLFIATGSTLTVFSSALGQPNGIQVTNIAALASSIVGVVGLVILLGLIVGAISIGADRAVVLESLSVTSALKRGWQLFLNYLPDFFVIGIMMIIVAFAIGILFACTIGALISSAVVGQFSLDAGFNPNAVATSPAFLASAFSSLIIGVLMEVLFSGVWTLAFRKWQGK